MKFFRSFALALSFLIASPAFSQTEAWAKDITDGLVSFMADQFIGVNATASRTWDYTELGVGKKVKGEGTATVSNFISASGTAEHIFFKIGNDIKSNHIETSNLVLNYRYDGTSIGRTFVYPSGSFLHHEWGWVHPKGDLTAKIFANPSRGYVVEIRFTVEADGDSRASQVVERAAGQLKFEFGKKLESYMTSVLGIPVRIDIL